MDGKNHVLIYQNSEFLTKSNPLTLDEVVSEQLQNQINTYLSNVSSAGTLSGKCGSRERCRRAQEWWVWSWGLGAWGSHGRATSCLPQIIPDHTGGTFRTGGLRSLQIITRAHTRTHTTLISTPPPSILSFPSQIKMLDHWRLQAHPMTIPFWKSCLDVSLEKTWNDYEKHSLTVHFEKQERFSLMLGGPIRATHIPKIFLPKTFSLRQL